MNIQTFSWLRKTFLLVAFAAFPAAPAFAGACAANTQCDFELTHVNVFSASPGDISIDIRVHVDNTGATTVLTVSFISDNLSNTPLGIDKFGYNSAALVTSPPPGWGKKGGPSPYTMDGFGDFTLEYDSPGGTDLTFSFTLASLVTSFTDNSHGGEFAVHIRYGGECSGFVSDGTAEQSKDGNCTIRKEAPEPGSLLLLGIAAAALALGRRRMGRAARPSSRVG